MIVSAKSNYLWCHELWSTTECACRGPVPHLLFAETVVRHFHMPIKRQQNVIKFEVTT